jgi:carboxymethylenebutenolidase
MLRNSMTFAFHQGISTIACAIVFIASCAAAEVITQELAVESNSGAVAVTRYAAEGTASRPAVLVLHGAGGLDVDRQDYARHGLTLAQNGIDAYLVRYFGSGDRSCNCWDVWAETVLGVATAILRRPEASGRVGLLGFSLGGAVAVTSTRDPRIAALVVFYGFIPKSQRARTADAPMGPADPRSTVLTPAEEAIIVAFRQRTLLPLEDVLGCLRDTIPNLSRSGLHAMAYRVCQRACRTRKPTIGYVRLQAISVSAICSLVAERSCWAMMD